jgi:hypothetical protein
MEEEGDWSNTVRRQLTANEGTLFLGNKLALPPSRLVPALEHYYQLGKPTLIQAPY